MHENSDDINDWKVIADNLSKADWTWGCTSRVDSNGKTTFVADAQRGDGKRFVVRADNELVAFFARERSRLPQLRFFASQRYHSWRKKWLLDRERRFTRSE
jgi:hypothetical protein